MTDRTVQRYNIKKAMIAIAPIEEKVEVILASDYDALRTQAQALAETVLMLCEKYGHTDYPSYQCAQAVLKEGA